MSTVFLSGYYRGKTEALITANEQMYPVMPREELAVVCLLQLKEMIPESVAADMIKEYFQGQLSLVEKLSL